MCPCPLPKLFAGATSGCCSPSLLTEEQPSSCASRGEGNLHFLVRREMTS